MSKINIQSEIMILMISLNPSVRSVAGLGIVQDKTQRNLFVIQQVNYFGKVVVNTENFLNN